ncbi:hypothetical protein [Anaerosporobacter faecicola]|nr:hypothetical protein [Anaerosporobacter faecicola]
MAKSAIRISRWDCLPEDPIDSNSENAWVDEYPNVCVRYVNSH